MGQRSTVVNLAPVRNLAAAVGLVLATLLAGAACSEQATPVGDASSPEASATTQQLTPHLLAPTEQMKQLARQQCLDHPDKTQGVVNAVDPGRPGEVLATVTLDCTSVRAGGSGETDTSSTGPTASAAATASPSGASPSSTTTAPAPGATASR